MNSRNSIVRCLAGALGLWSCLAWSHHSSTVFDNDASIERTGIVKEFIYRNPHLILNLDVTGEDGRSTLWKIEGQSISALRAMGFNRDSIAVGDRITVRMRPLRTGAPGGLLQGLRGADGKAYSMDSGSASPAYAEPARRQEAPALMAWVPPPAGETWQDRERKTRPPQLPIVSEGLAPGDDSSTGGAPGALDPANLAAERPPAPFDLTGVWQFRAEDEYRANYGSYEFKPMPQLTPKAQAFYDEHIAATKQGLRHGDPATQCYPTGMPRFLTRYGSMMMLQYPTAIFMVSRLNNEYRVIFLDGRERVPEADLDRNWNGESLGHWDGDTLVIETTGFTDENHLIQAGVIAGTQLRIVERYRMLNDGNTLAMEFTMTDPEHWVGEWKHVKFRDRVLRSDIKEASCILKDNLALPGT